MKTFTFFLVGLLLAPFTDLFASDVPYKVFDLPKSTKEIQRCSSDSKKLRADTISYNDLQVHTFALYCPGWGDDPLVVFNADTGQLLLDDPEGGLRHRSFPLAFSMSNDRTVLVSSTKTAVVNNTTGKLIQTIDNTLYEIADFDSDGIEDIAAITLTGGHERNPREAEVYLSKQDGSLELIAIGDIILKDKDGPLGVFNKDIDDPKRVKREFTSDFRHVKYNADTEEISHGKPYNATFLFNRLIDFSDGVMQGLALYKRSKYDLYKRSEMRVDRQDIYTDPSRKSRHQKDVADILDKLAEEYEYCYQYRLYSKTDPSQSKLNEVLNGILTCEDSFSDDRPVKKIGRYVVLNNHEVIKDIEDIIVKTPHGEFWLLVNDKRIRAQPNTLVKLNDPSEEPIQIDLRKLAGVGYDESVKTITGNYIYVWKSGKIHVLDMLDVVKKR